MGGWSEENGEIPKHPRNPKFLNLVASASVEVLRMANVRQPYGETKAGSGKFINFFE